MIKNKFRHNKLFFMFCALIMAFFCFQAFASEELPVEEIMSIAVNAVKIKSKDLSDVKIIYDEDNELWMKKIAKYKQMVNAPVFFIFKEGFMRNYRAVYFDFTHPHEDIWVFIHKDTGELLEVFTFQE